MKKSSLGVLLITASMTPMLLTGCNSNNDTKPADNGSASVTASESVGAYQDLAKPTCSKDKAGVWSAVGSIKNNDQVVKVYTVTASVINSKTHQVLGAKTQEVTVGGGKTEKLDMQKIFTTGAKDKTPQECVIGVFSKTK